MEQSTRAGMAQIRSPLDVMTMRALKAKFPEKTLFELQVMAAQDTETVQETEYEMLRMMYGGDASAMGRVLMRTRNLSPEQAIAYIQSREAAKLRLPLTVAGAPSVSPFAVATYQTWQMALLEGLEQSVTDMANKMAHLIEREPTPPMDPLEFERRTGTTLGGRGRAYVPPSDWYWGKDIKALIDFFRGKREEDKAVLDEMNGSLKSIDNKMDGILTDERR
jgi:hypothetical protein